MRKIILLSAMCISSNLVAQKIFFGINAGVNVANQRAVGPGSFYSLRAPASYPIATMYAQNAAKPTLGLYMEYQVLDKLGVRINAQYMGLGYNGKNLAIDNLDINYLTFPVSLKYSLTDRLSFGGGPYLSFTLGGTKLNNESITKYYHKNDFGFTLGAEYDVYKNFALAANYILGTKNIWLDDQGGSFRINNRALQFTLIYKFRKPVTAK